VGVEPERQDLHLVLELGEAAGEVIPLLAERLGQRHHGLDEPALAFVVRRDVFQAAPPHDGRATLSNSDAARAP
jgi:hypothetical protein